MHGSVKCGQPLGVKGEFKLDIQKERGQRVSPFLEFDNVYLLFPCPSPSCSSPSSTKKSPPQLQDKEIIILSRSRLFHGAVTKARSLV